VIRFTLRLVGRSSAWVAPTLVFLIWVAVTIGGRAPALSNAPGLFYATVVWATWMTVSTGNLDTDDHRDLLASVSGSATRLHAQRSISVLVLSLPVCVVAAAVTVAASVSVNVVRDWLICALMAVSGGLLGTSFGTLLHRPLLRHRGLTVLFALLLIIVAIVAPPSIWALDYAETGNTAAAVLIAASVGIWCATAISVAALLAATRAR